MNDLEICKRIAEIEDVPWMLAYPNTDKELVGLINGNDLTGTPPELIGEYNPLTDKALCFDLMVKYDVVFLDDEAYAGCESGAGPESGGYYCEGYGVSTSSPQRAICLAIIEAHED